MRLQPLLHEPKFSNLRDAFDGMGAGNLKDLLSATDKGARCEEDRVELRGHVGR